MLKALLSRAAWLKVASQVTANLAVAAFAGAVAVLYDNGPHPVAYSASLAITGVVLFITAAIAASERR